MASQMVHSRPSMRTQLPQRYARTAVCVRASEEPQRSTLDKATALIGAASLALLLSASAPDPAMAARSGGRAGGSSFSRAPSMRSRPAPSAPAPRAQGGVTNNYYGGGGMGMGMGGFGFSPFGISPFGMSPFGGTMIMGGGGLFSSFILLATISVAFSVISNAVRGAGKKDNKDDDSW